MGLGSAQRPSFTPGPLWQSPAETKRACVTAHKSIMLTVLQVAPQTVDMSPLGADRDVVS